VERSRVEEEKVGGRGSGPDEKGVSVLVRGGGRAFGGGRLGWELPASGLVEVVVRGGFRLGGIELGGLIEVAREGFLSDLFCFDYTEAHVELSLGRPPGGMKERRGGGLTDVGENPGNRLRVSEERDEGEGGPAGGADQREDLVDSGQKCGPRGGSGAACGGWLRFRVLGLGRRGRRGQGHREWESPNGILDGGETIQELEGREAERGAAREIRGREDVEHLVGAATDEVKPLESEGRSGTVADQALEAGSVVALDTDAGVEAKTTTVIPGEQRSRLRGVRGGHGDENGGGNGD
jgi:hypothetical protein